MSNKYPDLAKTKFPESVDDFITWLDITADDGPLVRDYMNAMNAGNKELANQILDKIPSGTQKIIKATNLNKLTQAILAVERFYKSDVQDYIQQEQEDWLRVIGQFSYKNAWSSGKSYTRNNLVSHVEFGVEYIYIAVTDNVPPGAEPSDTSKYWKKITIQGMQGESGEGTAYREYWEVSDQYDVNEMVTYDGALWLATKRSQGETPSRKSDAWELIMTLASVAYPIQSAQPANQDAGDLWFNTSGTPTDYYHLEPLGNPATAEDIATGKQAYDSFGNIIVGTR